MRTNKGSHEKKGCKNKLLETKKVRSSTYNWLQLGVKYIKENVEPSPLCVITKRVILRWHCVALSIYSCLRPCTAYFHILISFHHSSDNGTLTAYLILSNFTNDSMLGEVNDLGHRCQWVEIFNGISTHNHLTSVFIISPLGMFLSLSSLFSADIVFSISPLVPMSAQFVALKAQEFSRLWLKYPKIRMGFSSSQEHTAKFCPYLSYLWNKLIPLKGMHKPFLG